jgi:hypothetical protein
LEEARQVVHKRHHKTQILFRLDTLQQRIHNACKIVDIDDDERPLPEDIAILEPFKSTIFQFTDNESACLFVDDVHFVQLVSNWHRERKEYMLSLLPKDLTEDIDGNQVPDPLSLEVAYFCGNGDPTIQYYYQAICRVRQNFGELPSDAPRELLLLSPGEFRRPWHWDRTRWTFDFDRYTVAATMMIYLGMDPRFTSPGNFLSRCVDIQLHCIQCKEEEDRGRRNCWSAVSNQKRRSQGRNSGVLSPDTTRAGVP